MEFKSVVCTSSSLFKYFRRIQKVHIWAVIVCFFKDNFSGRGLASYDETALVAPAFRVLRTMAQV